MNDQDPKPGVVIEVTAEPDTDQDASGAHTAATENARPDAPTRTRAAGRVGVVALVVAVLALAGVVALALLGNRQVSDTAQRLAQLDTRLGEALQAQQRLGRDLSEATTSLNAQAGALDEQRDLLAQQRVAVDDARNAFQAQEQRLADENVRLQEREAELRAAVADVHRRVGRSGTQWIIAETEYLMRIANHRLQLARDSETARVALELADQRLRDTRDPGWAGVREQLARDIAKLAALDPPDSAGLAARIGALIEQIPQLKIARATIGAERTLPEQVARTPSERSWDTLLDDLWSGFKDAVRIRERDKPVQAMLPPEQQFFLYENLKLHLETARLGLARLDPAQFRDSLTTAADWLGRYFEPGDPTAAALRSAIETMRDTDIRPALPDISHSLRALQARRQLLDSEMPAASPTPATATDGIDAQ